MIYRAFNVAQIYCEDNKNNNNIKYAYGVLWSMM